MKWIGVLMAMYGSVFGCVCEPNIAAAFNGVETAIIMNNINPLNNELASISVGVKNNIDAINNETEEYRALIEHEKALYVMYKEMLFEVQKQVDLQANQNNVTAIDVQAILKQNEELAIIRAKKAVGN